MSVVSVTEEKRWGEISYEGIRRFRAFQVVTDDVSDDDVTVLAAALLPALYSYHPNDSSILCMQKTAERITANSRLQWKVVCTYFIPEGGPDIAGDPWDLPPQISFKAVGYDRAVDKAYQVGDFRGAQSLAIENSATMSFDPPVMQEEFNLMISIERNEEGAAFDPEDLYTYQATMNKFLITVAGILITPWVGFMQDIRATKAWTTDGTVYWKTGYDIVVDHATHEKQILDQGYYEADAAGPLPDPIKDAKGNDMHEPSKLDGAGKVLAFGLPAVFLPFPTYWAQDWAPLGLPNSE